MAATTDPGATDPKATDGGMAGARIDLRCRCGVVHGTLDPANPINHLVCYCADCRAFARRCGGDALDAAGGLELFQTTAGRIELTGAESLAALRVTERGPYRWYCGACGTALANTLPSSALPFATVVAAALHGDRAALGPIRGAVFTSSAPRPPLHPRIGVAGVVARFARAMVGARWRGEQRRSPFHRPDGRAIAPAPVMDPDERARLAG